MIIGKYVKAIAALLGTIIAAIVAAVAAAPEGTDLLTTLASQWDSIVGQALAVTAAVFASPANKP